MSKLLLAAAGAAGYVLGTRAGRERYEQIRAQAQRIWQDPRVRQQTTQATETVKAKAPMVKSQLTEAGKRAANKARTVSGRGDGTAGETGKDAALGDAGAPASSTGVTP